jgi:hypothetical protein
MQDEPLELALREGFTNLEVDVHLVQGKLLVGHSLSDAQQKELSLEEAYLAPLQKRVDQYGSVYPQGPEVDLLLDFKGSAEPTYEALKPLLERYSEMLVSRQDGQTVAGAVQVIVTGNRPAIDSQQDGHTFLEAQLNEALLRPDQVDPAMTPTVSGPYRMYFRWDGRGTMPEKEQKRLSAMAEDMHGLGLQLRLWDAPDQPNAWQTFARLGVDRINTDDLSGFSQWHISYSSPLAIC